MTSPDDSQPPKDWWLENACGIAAFRLRQAKCADYGYKSAVFELRCSRVAVAIGVTLIAASSHTP